MNIDEKIFKNFIDDTLSFFDWIKGAIQKNYPVSISQWLDIYSLKNVPIATTGFTLFSYEVPTGKYGVIKGFVFSLKNGNPDNISAYIKVNNIPMPLSEDITNTQIVSEPQEIQPTHIELKPFDKIVIQVDNNDLVQSADFFGRIIGWLYEKK